MASMTFMHLGVTPREHPRAMVAQRSIYLNETGSTECLGQDSDNKQFLA